MELEERLQKIGLFHQCMDFQDDAYQVRVERVRKMVARQRIEEIQSQHELRIVEIRLWIHPLHQDAVRVRSRAPEHNEELGPMPMSI